MSPTSLTSYNDALNLIAESIPPTQPVQVHWQESLWQTLAQDVHAREAVPKFDNSAVDGFAVQAEDLEAANSELPVALQLLEAIYAGKPVPQKNVGTGSTTKIMTGAPLPTGANAVVMVEQTRQEGDRVLFTQTTAKGQNIRKAGEEIKQGQIILFSGDPVHSAELGLLAQQGIDNTQVRRNPTVAILATGDELVDPGDPCEGGQIRNANTYTLMGELQQIHCPVLNLGIGRDNPDELRKLLKQGIEEADILITSGGVSAGEKDYLPALLSELGMKTIFHKVSVKPGKPLLFGKTDDCAIFGLPGNMVSSMVSFHLFVKPAIRLHCGRDLWRNPCHYARMGQPIKNPGGRTNFVRCRLSHTPTGLPIALPTGQQGSGMLTSMRNVDGFAVLPSDKTDIAEFDVVEFIPLV